MPRDNRPNILYLFTDQQSATAADRSEMVNLAVNDGCAKTLQEHRDLLESWCVRIGDRFKGRIPGVRDKELADTSHQ